MKIVVEITHPIGSRFKWKGRDVRIPSKLVLNDENELERFERFANVYGLKINVLTNIKKEEPKQEPAKEEVETVEDNKLTYEDLKKLSKDELLELAKERNIEVPEKIKRQKLIKLILENQ